MNMRIKLAMVFIPLGLFIAAVPESKTKAVKSGPDKILSEVRTNSHLITTDAVADMLIQKDPGMVLIDVRSKGEFDAYHIPGAVNIPIDNILADEWAGYFDQLAKMNVLYSNGNSKATEAWMLLRQKGYKSNYVMQGGMNYWAETIMNPEKPASTSPDDEIARYNFRKAAGGVLGGGAIAPADNKVPAPAPAPVPRRPKKKRAAGGC
ncbi:rhodanese-like domain-containing protein [Prolixibacter sp. SD074]|uniref:rhodanese-like domain-containing protein n=1 Tax=Prolixibacter sp. SD074 TaxID=2652391 RepID=UPI00188F5ECD|nr:rhodanese-like domain-containing protein [Prolixibacter sp. SD074]